MVSRIGIDQAGVIHKTNDHTVIAWCDMNSLSNYGTVLITKQLTSKLHSRLKSSFKKENRVSWFQPKIFAIATTYLLEDIVEDVNEVIMEDEYPGNMDDVQNYLANKLDVEYDKFTVQPTTHKYNAHRIANQKLGTPSKVDRKLKFQDFRKRI